MHEATKAERRAAARTFPRNTGLGSGARRARHRIPIARDRAGEVSVRRCLRCPDTRGLAPHRRGRGPLLVRHLERTAEELLQRRRGATDARVLVDEAGGDDVALAQAGPAEEVLPPQVVGEGVPLVGPRRNALERVAAELEPFREGAAARGLPPALRLRD